jgi:hypothetical protein
MIIPKYIVYSAMLFMHIFADFNLQGLMGSMKQKKWWEENAPSPLYQYDYIIALYLHSFQWAFCIMLPIVIYNYHNEDKYLIITIMLFVNSIAHYIIDHIKANLLKINLIQDQCFHIIQLIITYALCM